MVLQHLPPGINWAVGILVGIAGVFTIYIGRLIHVVVSHPDDKVRHLALTVLRELLGFLLALLRSSRGKQ